MTDITTVEAKLAEFEEANKGIFADIELAKAHIHTLQCAANQAKQASKKAAWRIKKATKVAHNAQGIIDSMKEDLKNSALEDQE